jgi:hypothetical protein
MTATTTRWFRFQLALPPPKIGTRIHSCSDRCWRSLNPFLRGRDPLRGVAQTSKVLTDPGPPNLLLV